jgi:hypothetical protein
MFGISHVKLGFRSIRYEKFNKHTDINDRYIVYPWRIVENAWYMLLGWLSKRNGKRLIVVEASQRNIDFVAGIVDYYGDPIIPKVEPKRRRDLSPEESKEFNTLMDRLRTRSKGFKDEYKVEYQETTKKDINNG